MSILILILLFNPYQLLNKFRGVPALELPFYDPQLRQTSTKRIEFQGLLFWNIIVYFNFNFNFDHLS